MGDSSSASRVATNFNIANTNEVRTERPFDTYSIFDDIGCVHVLYPILPKPIFSMTQKSCEKKEANGKIKEFNISFQFIQFWSIDKESIYGIH